MLAALVEIDRGGPMPDQRRLREANGRWLDEHLDRDVAAFLAVVNGNVVASACLMTFAHPPGPYDAAGTEGYVLNVFTRPEWRGQGAATALMRRIIAEARAMGVGRLWLRTSPQGRPLYEGLGFSEGSYLELRIDKETPADQGGQP
jgi:GNAT superfamily N-acetyltransferase